MLGARSQGRLGNGSTVDRPEPKEVAGGHAFIAIDAGNLTTCGFKENGELWCWGEDFGNTPVQVSY